MFLLLSYLMCSIKFDTGFYTSPVNFVWLLGRLSVQCEAQIRFHSVFETAIKLFRVIINGVSDCINLLAKK
jgi:hypothetical protein